MERIINTASDSGLFGNPGQSNYGAAKSGIATFSIIVSRELRKYANVNCVVPSAATRMTIDAMPEGHPLREMMGKGQNKSGLKVYDPANFAPLVAYLASDESAEINGHVFRAVGDAVWIYQPWQIVNEIHNNGKAFTPSESNGVHPQVCNEPSSDTLTTSLPIFSPILSLKTDALIRI